MFNLTRYFPPGTPYRPEIRILIAALILSILRSLQFLLSFSAAKADLYVGGELIPGAVMPDFVDLLGTSFLGFFIILAGLLLLTAIHYSSFYQGSKSIYLMRRLPDGFELHRRALSFPLAAMLITLLLAFLFLVIYYHIYMNATPKICLTPDQWQKIWRFP